MEAVLIEKRFQYKVNAEYDKADVIIMHEPSSELYYGILHPNAALFDTYFNAEKAAKEHAIYRKLLQENGAEVHTIKEILLKNVVDNEGEPIEGLELEKFRLFARSCVRINTNNKEGLSVEEIEEQHSYLDEVFKVMHPVDLVRTVLLQPNLILKKTKTNTFVTADYNANPVMNLYFSRDQIITTAKGIVITNLNSPQREIETKIIEICIQNLGLTTVLNLSKINKKAYLEGGDFFMLGNTALIGEGMRTNFEAIQELMNADAIGTETLAVIKDSYHYQPQMHLDTYFNVIDQDLVAISEERYYTKKGAKKELLVDVYKKDENGYQLKVTNISFKEYLNEHLNVEIIVISEQDQKNMV